MIDMNKKRFFTTLSFLLLFFFLGGSFFLTDLAKAQPPTPPPTPSPEETQTPDFDLQKDAFAENAGFEKTPKDPRAVVSLIISYGLSVLGVMLLAYLVYGGFLIMTSAGEEEKVNNGKSTIRTAIIGLAIMLAVYSITTFAFYLAGGGNESANGGPADPTTQVGPPPPPDDSGGGASTDRCVWIFCD